MLFEGGVQTGFGFNVLVKEKENFDKKAEIPLWS